MKPNFEILDSIIYDISDKPQSSLKNLFGTEICWQAFRFQITDTKVVEGIGKNGNENNYNIESGMMA